MKAEKQVARNLNFPEPKETLKQLSHGERSDRCGVGHDRRIRIWQALGVSLASQPLTLTGLQELVPGRDWVDLTTTD